MKKRADGFGEEEPVGVAEQSSAIRTDGFGEEEPVDDGFGEEEPVRAIADDGFGEEEPVDDGFGAEEPVDGAPEKKSLGIFGTLGAQTAAKAGREVGTVEAIAENLPVVGQVMDAEYNRQWNNLRRLYEGDFQSDLEARILAKQVGISEDDMQRINEEAGYGGRNLFGNYTQVDMDTVKARFKELVAPEFAKRLQARQAAEGKVAGSDLNWVQKGVVGGAGATKLMGSMAAPWLAGMTLSVDATNRAAQQLEGKWVLDKNGDPTKIWWKLDEKGEPVRDEAGNLVPREEISGDMAMLKGFAGAGTERFIWMGLGKVAKAAGGALVGAAEKTAAGAKVSEAIANVAARGLRGTEAAIQEATEWLGKTALGRGVLNVGKALGWLNEKGKFGSIPDMMVKSRIQEFADEVVGLSVADPSEREEFGKWLGKFVSVKENVELFTEMLAMHLAMKAGGKTLKLAGKGLERTGVLAPPNPGPRNESIMEMRDGLAELIGEERAKKLTDKDLINLYGLVTSKGFTAERAEQFAEKIAGDVDAAQKLIDEGASLSSLAEGLKTRRQYSDEFVAGAKAAAAELRDRVTLDDVQSGKVNNAALNAAEGNVEIAAKVAALAKARLTNKHTQVDDADGLEALVAEAMRPFEPEARAVKIHDLKGNRDVGAQLTALEELGIASVEDAELNGVVKRDESGQLTGDARQAVNIAAHGTETLKGAVRDGAIDAATAEALITVSHTELGAATPEERAAFIDGVLERAKGDAALARRMVELAAEAARPDMAVEGLDAIAERAKASLELEEPHQARLDEITGCKLTSIEGGKLGCSRFRGMTAEFEELGPGDGDLTQRRGEAESAETSKVLRVKGLGEGQLAKPGNWADGAVLVAELQRVAEKNGAVLDFGSIEANTEAAGLLNKVQTEGLERAKARLETRAKLFDILSRSALDTGVTFDEASFRKALEESPNGSKYRDNHGNIYGITSQDGTLHFDPTQLDYNIPIHEYGHLALESMKGVNRRLWERGMELVKGSDYYRSIKEQAETEGHEYSYLKGDEAGICDEALATMIGDRGEKLVEEQGVGAELKAWLKDFWKAFKGAFGLADMTDAQIEKMTLGEFVDAVNAELLRGKEFGTRKEVPLKEKSIRRYDEAEGSGSNGILRWKNDRGRLFYIPVDMERTRPGGKVVLATDDANITDWIKNRLNGVELRMSKSGEIYVKGRNGLEGEMAEIFGRYPKAGQNDGIFEGIATDLQNESLREMTPDQLVEALAKDRANYDEWVKATRDGKVSLEDAKLEQHYAEEAEREEAEARRRWEDSGMDLPEYILSRIEEGEPGFDLDWETMREMDHDVAMGKFAARRAPSQTGQEYTYAALTAKPDMPVVQVDAERAKQYGDHVSWKLADARKSILAAGGRLERGHYVIDMEGEPVEVGKKGLLHGKHNRNNDFIYPILGDVLKNAVRVNELGVREGFREEGKKDDQVNSKFVYLGAAAHGDVILPVRIQIDRKAGRFEIGEIDVLKSINAKVARAPAEADLTGHRPPSISPTQISISNLIDIAQPLHPQIFSKEVAAALNKPYQGDEIGAKFAVGGQTSTQQFKNWFAESKVVDANGEPLVVYRGAEFDPLAQETGKGVIKPEAYFTADPEYAKRYTGNGGKVQAYYLNIRNPFDIRRPECLADLKKVYPDHEFQKGKSGALDWAEASTIDGEFLKENFGDKYDGIIYDEGGDPGESGVSYRGISYVPLDGGAQVKSATENIGTFDPGNPDVRFAAGVQSIGDFVVGPNGIARRGTPQAAMIGGARVADDAGYGERTPGSMAASRELSEQPRSRIQEIGRVRVASFPISEIFRMHKDLSGNPMPVHVSKRVRGGKVSASSKDGQIYIASDVIGLVDRTDIPPLKEKLAQHGFFRHENEAWAKNHSPAEVRQERERSENQLGDELRNLAGLRASGKEPGGQSAERIVYMNEFAKYVMNMPRKKGSLVGDVQTVGDAVRGSLNVLLAAGGDKRAEREKKMRDEAKRLLTWSGWRVEDATEADMKDLTDTMFGAWLAIPEEMERVAPTWYDAILSTITTTPSAAKAYRAAAERTVSSPHAYKSVLEEIQKSQSAAVQAIRDKLDAEAKAPITARSLLRRFAEGLVLGYHDRMGLTWMRFDEETKEKLKARRNALAELKRKGATKAELKAAAEEIDLFTGRIYQTKQKLELSRSAMERGIQNEGVRYVILNRLLEDKATKKWGLSEADKSLYLDQLWVIDSQGRSGIRGESARQARLILGDMARRLGSEKWARMEEYGREWFSIRERELLNDPRLERLVGKDVVAYWRSNAHYVTTKRVQSPEEMEAIERTREKMRKAGMNGGDDVCGEMFSYIGDRGGREHLGEKLWKGRLSGSFADKAEVRGATTEKDMKIQQAARVNQYVVDLRDALLMAEVPGVRDMPYGKADVKEGSRYGFINYFDYGEKRTLIVPREIADGFRRDPDTFQWTAQMHRVARGMMIDYNLGYLPVNQMRNAGSIEKNMPGVYESWAKTLAGFTGIPGAAPLVDLFLEHAARKSAKTDRMLGKVFFGITRFGHINPAERAAKFIFDPEGWQKKFWDAEARGDEDTMRGLIEDKDFAMSALRANMFTTLGGAYGDAVRDERLLSVGKKIGAAIDRTPVARTLKKGADWLPRQNEFEDVFAKLVAFHHDRAMFGKAHNRTVEESGLVVKQNVSIGEGERRGRNTNAIQTFFGQFFNMREKGVVRHVKAYFDRPREMLVKAGMVWGRRCVGTMFATGAIAAFIRWLYGDDDKKAEESPLGGTYRFAKFMQAASQNINDYARKRHQLVPVWLSPDGYTTITLGAALNDEDSLIAPSADFVARAVSARMGLNPPPELGQTVLDTVWRGIAPDLDPSTPIVKTLRDTIYALADNPMDDFTGKPVYDPVLYAVRNESWAARVDFATEMAKRVWDDWGASAIWKFDRYGKESSDYGSASKWLGLALNDIPVVSSATRRFVKIHVREPGRGSGVDAAVSAEDRRRANVRQYLSDDLLKRSEKMGGAMNRMDPKQYGELLADWQGTYGLSLYDMRLIEKRFLNKWSDRENREWVRNKKRNQLLRKAQRMGIEESERRMIRGDR